MAKEDRKVIPLVGNLVGHYLVDNSRLDYGEQVTFNTRKNVLGDYVFTLRMYAQGKIRVVTFKPQNEEKAQLIIADIFNTFPNIIIN